MGAIGAFLVGSAKLALALVIVVVVIAFGAWRYSSWQTQTQTATEAPLAVKKQWETQRLLSLIPVDVATAWRNGQTYYQVRISDYTEQEYSRRADAHITLQFHDDDGFALWEKRIPWAEMTALVKDGKRIEGYTWTGNERTSSEDYARVARLDIAWNGITATTTPPPDIMDDFIPDPLPEPAAPPAVAWSVLANWRTLAAGFNQDAVRAKLGEPTKVDQISARLTIWRYGDMRNGGEVTFTNGAVWS